MIKWILILFGVGLLSSIPFAKTRTRIVFTLISGLWVIIIELLLNTLEFTDSGLNQPWLPTSAVLPGFLISILFLRMLSPGLTWGTLIYTSTLTLFLTSPEVKYILLHGLVGYGAFELSNLSSKRKLESFFISRAAVGLLTFQVFIYYLSLKVGSKWPHLLGVSPQAELFTKNLGFMLLMISLIRIFIFQYRSFTDFQRSLQAFPLLIELWGISLLIQEYGNSITAMNFIFLCLGIILSVLTKMSLDRLNEKRRDTFILCFGSIGLWVLFSPWFEKGQAWSQWGQLGILALLILFIIVGAYQVHTKSSPTLKKATQVKTEAPAKSPPLLPFEKLISSTVEKWNDLELYQKFYEQGSRTLDKLDQGMRASLQIFEKIESGFIIVSFQGAAILFLIGLVVYLHWGQAWNFMN